MGCSGLLATLATAAPGHATRLFATGGIALLDTAVGTFPRVQDERTVTKGEVLATTLAKAARLDVAAARIVEGGGSIRQRRPRRRMAFSILITDADDHLHNHAFLHAERASVGSRRPRD